jgi:hypothetical protein
VIRLFLAALCLALCAALAWSQDYDAPERDQQPSSGAPGSPTGPGIPAGPQGPQGPGSTEPLLPAQHPQGSGHAPRPAVPTAAPGEPGGLNGGGGGYEGGKEGARHGKDDLPRAGDAGPVTDDDARESIGQVVETFLAQRSVNGAWRIVDKRTKKPRLLKLLAVHEKKMSKKDDAVYSVPVSFKDLASGQTVKTLFTVDFTPPEWKVVGAHLLR